MKNFLICERSSVVCPQHCVHAEPHEKMTSCEKKIYCSTMGMRLYCVEYEEETYPNPKSCRNEK